MENNILIKKNRLLCVLSGTSSFKLKNKNNFNDFSVLVGKLMYYNNEIDLNNLIDSLSENNISKFKIIIIKNKFNSITADNHKNVRIITMDYQYFLIIMRAYIEKKLNKDNAIGYLKDNNFFEEIFHNLDHSTEIKPLFIFEDFSWFNILFLLKTININFTGGNTPRRHLFSNLEFDLSLYLNVLFKQSGLKISEFRKLIYDSYNTKFWTKSTFESDDLFNEDLSQLHEFNLQFGIFLEYLIYLNNKFKKLDEIQSSIDEYKNKIKSANNNIKSSYKNKNKDIINYNKKIQDLNLELSSFKNNFYYELNQRDFKLNDISTKLESLIILYKIFSINTSLDFIIVYKNLFDRLNKFINDDSIMSVSNNSISNNSVSNRINLDNYY